MEGIMLALQDDLAQLVPNARHLVATESGHDIHQHQPELVIDAIREVVEAVRDPNSWATGSATPPGLGIQHPATEGASRTSRFVARFTRGGGMIRS